MTSMPDVSPVIHDEPASGAAEQAEQTLRIHAEQVVVSRRQIPTGTVRVARVTREADRLVEEDLTHEQVEVKRIPVGRTVDAVPAVRVEGDVTILSVVEEVVVIERRLVLKEEVHVRRVRTTERHVETVIVREQTAEVTRTQVAKPDQSAIPPPSNPQQLGD